MHTYEILRDHYVLEIKPVHPADSCTTVGLLGLDTYPGCCANRTCGARGHINLVDNDILVQFIIELIVGDTTLPSSVVFADVPND